MALSSRQLLLHSAFAGHPTSADDPSASGGPGFDSNVVTILAVLFCAVIFALGINSVVRCALRSSGQPDPLNLAVAASRRRAIRKLPVELYSVGPDQTGSGSECVICLGEIRPGERVRQLPKCRHVFHVRCVDQWLVVRPSCPVCRQCLFGASHTSSGCAEPESAVRAAVQPLEAEGLATAYML
ncbi:RING-H2 finger protein ATL78 [Apostasia shenzhenica]|uniref:RING-H2 finger protein ATL78 n=1 Tax=Apostasia shenzhenica TaxID=1088818 RepID=A0A2I0B170_9ASPA|nr:RING-H2 finger protein ATL78 [Apostasia shenzhenica]